MILIIFKAIAGQSGRFSKSSQSKAGEMTVYWAVSKVSPLYIKVGVKKSMIHSVIFPQDPRKAK